MRVSLAEGGRNRRDRGAETGSVFESFPEPARSLKPDLRAGVFADQRRLRVSSAHSTVDFSSDADRGWRRGGVTASAEADPTGSAQFISEAYES